MDKAAVSNLKHITSILVRKSDWTVTICGKDITDRLFPIDAAGMMHKSDRFFFYTEEEALGFVRGLSQLIGKNFIVDRNDNYGISMISLDLLRKTMSPEELRQKYGERLPLVGRFRSSFQIE